MEERTPEQKRADKNRRRNRRARTAEAYELACRFDLNQRPKHCRLRRFRRHDDARTRAYRDHLLRLEALRH